ncbi:MAG: sulfotransferase [Bacteroidota bacterium]
MLLIIGVPRSGTTLLSVMLNNHSEIFIDDQTVSKRIVLLYKKYDRYYLAKDQLSERFLNIVDKDDKKNRIYSLLNGREIINDISYTLDKAVKRKAKKNGALILGDKSPLIIELLPYFINLFPESKIVFITRDARANVMSLVKRQYMDIQLAAQMWKDWNIKGLAYKEWLGKDKICQISYEGLVKYTEQELLKICNFLNIDFETSMLDLSKSEATQKKDAYVSKQIDESLIERWRGELSTKQIKQIEKIVGDLMPQLGYKVEHENLQYQSLSYGKQYLLNVKQAVKLIFVPKRKVMRQRTLVDEYIPLSIRLRYLLRVMARGLINERWFEHR